MYDVLNAYLENGLKVVLHKIPGVKTISCGIWIKQGSIYETDENNGLSHLLEHLILNADNIDNPKYQKIMEQINEVCKSCLELPFCIAGCKYVRLEDENLCIKKRGDGLSIEEHALLDYYYDLKREKRNGTKSRI